jgi:hypothetical protein
MRTATASAACSRTPAIRERRRDSLASARVSRGTDASPPSSGSREEGGLALRGTGRQALRQYKLRLAGGHGAGGNLHIRRICAGLLFPARLTERTFMVKPFFL